MTKSLNAMLDEAAQDRDEAARERAETEAQRLAIRKERFDVEDSYRKLAALGREEAQLRERHIEGLKQERAVFFTKTLWLILGAGFIGAMCYWWALAVTRWLGATFLAVVSSGWAALAAWWSS